MSEQLRKAKELAEKLILASDRGPQRLTGCGKNQFVRGRESARAEA
jgi:hypothetical protein